MQGLLPLHLLWLNTNTLRSSKASRQLSIFIRQGLYQERRLFGGMSIWILQSLCSLHCPLNRQSEIVGDNVQLCCHWSAWSRLQELWRGILLGTAGLPALTSVGLQRWAESCVSPCVWDCLRLGSDVFSVSSSATADVGSGASRGARRGDPNNFQEWLRMTQRHFVSS